MYVRNDAKSKFMDKCSSCFPSHAETRESDNVVPLGALNNNFNYVICHGNARIMLLLFIGSGISSTIASLGNFTFFI